MAKRRMTILSELFSSLVCGIVGLALVSGNAVDGVISVVLLVACGSTLLMAANEVKRTS